MTEPRPRYDSTLERVAGLFNEVTKRAEAIDAESLVETARQHLARAEEVLANVAAIEGSVVDRPTTSMRTTRSSQPFGWTQVAIVVAGAAVGAYVLGRKARG
jgi:hypothetical protein